MAVQLSKEEKQVLHGIYYLSQCVGQERLFCSSEILWLLKTKVPATRNWKDASGHPQKCIFNPPTGDYLEDMCREDGSAERPLRHLHGAGHISCRFEKDHLFRWKFYISVTADGAHLARQLDTVGGRMNLWYEERKDGIVWLFLTAFVSAVVSVFTALLAARLEK